MSSRYRTACHASASQADLNPWQAEAARYLDGPLLVLAGAGNGKTRARGSLTLSLAQHRHRGGVLQACVPSRFLGELPEEDLYRQGGGAHHDPAARRERDQAHLANLRELLQQRQRVRHRLRGA